MNIFSKPILLKEIAYSIKNIQSFKDKYQTNISDEEIEKIFNRFNSQKPRLKIKSIFGYNSLQDLMNALGEKSGKEVEKSIKTTQANIIIDNDRMTVVEPLTIDASKKYGANTKWCTTSNDDETNGFDYWFKDYSLVYLIDKINNKKYAIAFNPYLDEQGWDETDDDKNVDEILDIFDLDFNDVFDKVIPKDYPKEL